MKWVTSSAVTSCVGAASPVWSPGASMSEVVSSVMVGTLSAPNGALESVYHCGEPAIAGAIGSAPGRLAPAMERPHDQEQEREDQQRLGQEIWTFQVNCSESPLARLTTGKVALVPMLPLELVTTSNRPPSSTARAEVAAIVPTTW